MAGSNKTWATVFARGGSKGVVGKNLREINGVSLVERAVRKALITPSIERVFLSTDCPKIRSAGQKAGAEAPFLRPQELSTDEAPELLSWQHMVKYWAENFSQLPDNFVSVPTVCPLGTPNDIERTIQSFLSADADIALTVTEDHSRSAFLTGQVDDDGLFKLFFEKRAARRQDFPRAFKIIALCYVTTPAYVLRSEDLLSGAVKPVSIPQERALDIDTEFEMELAAMLLNNCKNEYLS